MVIKLIAMHTDDASSIVNACAMTINFSCSLFEDYNVLLINSILILFIQGSC